jgi:hypothetical protein
LVEKRQMKILQYTRANWYCLGLTVS